ncbi:DUF418 domain-containing protein [Bacillus testis]|uniref:DUF418 domain-containing protein n=1 Tax=Bacillus testis TaxID=1622072 RepID=UPI00067E7F04|nr:DUF418 domain-containing protein [Bacillus testis]
MDSSFGSNGGNRIIALDILRGFAILGIFFVNIPYFFTPILYIDPQHFWQSANDRIVNTAVDIFAQASFYPLFSFLFGYGAVLIAERSMKKGQLFHLVFLRRMLLLLIIGLIHAFLVWYGDILITYSICGFFLLLFYGRSARTLLRTGCIMYIAFWGVFIGLTALSEIWIQPDLFNLMDHQTEALQAQAHYSSGTFKEIFRQRVHDWSLSNNVGSYWILILNILPLMLIGAGFAKKRWLAEAHTNKKLFARLLVVGLIGGFSLKCLPYVWKKSYTAYMIQDFIGGPLVGLFYLALIVLLLQNDQAKRVLHPFSYTGRLSISNYLLQSVFASFLFYSYGLGLYGKISYTEGVGIVIAFYGLQAAVSKYWTSKYRMGPVEYVWRWGTYGKKPLLRK